MHRHRPYLTRAGRAAARLAALVITLGGLAYADPQAPPADAPPPETPPAAPRPRVVEARADELLKAMSTFLAKQPRFALEAEETIDEVYASAPRIQFTNLRRVAVQRPGRIAADATGDSLNRAIWYDGKTLTALDKDDNTYLTVEMPASIDGVLDKLAIEYGVVVPLSDLLYADPYATLMEGVIYGEYVGIHQAAGVLCHHLAFSQESIDWQIWIETGDQPLPRKILITYAEEPGAPQYAATIRRWSLEPKFDETLFQFEAPEGATRVNAPAPSSSTPPPASPEKKEGTR